MKLKIDILIIIAAIFAVVATVSAQDHVNLIADQNMGGFNLAMMGGGGMGGGGMMGGNGGFNGFGWLQPNWQNPERDYQQHSYRDNQSVEREEIQRLHQRIEQKRRELSSLYRSGTANENEIKRKTDELNNLERSLDNKILGYDNR